MTFLDRYRDQWRWRSWSTILDALPDVSGSTILDLGCGIGDLATALSKRGARVVGIDSNEAAIELARSRQIPNAEFVHADLRTLPDRGLRVDGIWCSFTAAYFTNLPKVLAGWAESIRPEGWVALTEIDDLFGHRPLGDRTIELFERYRSASLDAGRYDFRMGRKLEDYARRSGLSVTRSFSVPDDELSFDGPAAADVVAAWRTRLDGMAPLRDFLADDYGSVREEFLESLSRPEHRSIARVLVVIATKPAG